MSGGRSRRWHFSVQAGYGAKQSGGLAENHENSERPDVVARQPVSPLLDFLSVFAIFPKL